MTLQRDSRWRELSRSHVQTHLKFQAVLVKDVGVWTRYPRLPIGIQERNILLLHIVGKVQMGVPP